MKLKNIRKNTKNNYYLRGKKNTAFFPDTNSKMFYFPSEVREIINREFVYGKKAPFYRLIRKKTIRTLQLQTIGLREEKKFNFLSHCEKK